MKTDNILILSQPKLVDQVELIDDCACEADQSLLPPTLTRHELFPQKTRLNRVSGLHIQPITNKFQLICNLKSQDQIGLLNREAQALLNHYATPRLFDSTEDVFPHISRPLLQQYTQRLLELGVLEATYPEELPNDSIVQEETIPPNQTLTAWLHITNQCNLRCSYCYIHKTPDKMALETGKRSIDAVIRSAVAHKFKRIKLKYAGGEATLNFGLVAALQAYAQAQAAQHQLTLQSVVLSNGVVITDAMIDFLKAQQMKLMISLDGVGQAHDSQRPFINGRGSFAQVEKSLDKLAKHNFLPDISITISNRNLHDLPNTVKYVLDRKLPFSLNFYRENECSSGADDLRYANTQMIDAMLAVFAVIEKNLPEHSLLSSIVDRANLQQAHTRTCGVGQNYLVIDQNGGVAKCHMEIEKPITTIHAKDPLQLVNQDTLGIQNLHVEEKEGCRDCDWRYWCAGGCPLLTYRATGRYDVKSPNCEIYKAIFPEVLRLEGLRILKHHGLLN